MNGYNKNLREIHISNKNKVSDKWEIYLDVYEGILAPYRNQNIKLLEIGIQNGGSLDVWSQYFKNPLCIIGCDIDTKCSSLIYGDPSIKVIVGDATSNETKNKILNTNEYFDIIIEDASHKSSHIIKAFVDFFPYLNDDGVFIIEDIHCSYWKEWEGGLYYPFSSLSFFKCIVDIINNEHWGVNKTINSYLKGFIEHYNLAINIESFTHIHSIEFVNSMCIIKKKISTKNVLGRRIISGQDAIVSNEPLTVNNTFHTAPNQSDNFWSNLILSPAEEYVNLKERIQKQEEHIAELQRIIQSMRIKNRIKKFFGLYK